MLSISLLGDFSIRRDEMPVLSVDTPRLQSLLAYLALHKDAPQSRAHLAFLFWPDTTEAQARTNLRNLLHSLRGALPNIDSYLDASVQTLKWGFDVPFTLDVTDFRAALARAEQSLRMNNSAAAREALEQAVALYKGDLLPSCYEDWIIPQREELREAYLNSLERLVQMLEEQRDYQGAIHNAQRLLRHDTLHEEMYRRLIRLHALKGDRASALWVYHTCTTTLKRELDVEPSAATREAYLQLLGTETRPPQRYPRQPPFLPWSGGTKSGPRCCKPGAQLWRAENHNSCCYAARQVSARPGWQRSSFNGQLARESLAPLPGAMPRRANWPMARSPPGCAPST